MFRHQGEALDENYSTQSSQILKLFADNQSCSIFPYRSSASAHFRPRLHHSSRLVDCRPRTHHLQLRRESLPLLLRPRHRPHHRLHRADRGAEAEESAAEARRGQGREGRQRGTVTRMELYSVEKRHNKRIWCSGNFETKIFKIFVSTLVASSAPMAFRFTTYFSQYEFCERRRMSSNIQNVKINSRISGHMFVS